MTFTRSNGSKWAERLIAAGAGAAVGILISRNFFNDEKNIREFPEPDFGVGDPAFRRTVVSLLGPALIEGNHVEPLCNGCHIFPSMLRAVQEAQHSITFENFVWWEGKVTRQFADALTERARAGVKVHFLQDALGSNSLFEDSMNSIRDCEEIELEIFRLYGISQMNQRTHRKLLIVDGRVGFIGGLGIADQWDGNADCATRWRDMQYRVEGPVVAQMQQAFMENWLQTRGCVLLGDEYYPELQPVGPHTCQVFKSSATDASESARLLLLLSIAAARKNIRIANAYFVPDALVIEALLKARARGVDVEVIGPGPLIDQELVRMVGRKRWKDLLAAGVRFYEFERSRFHCKYLIVDDCWCSVGSTNIDDRSLRLNDEANLNVLDADFAAEHTRIFEQDKRDSREITVEEWEGRSTKEKILATVGNVFRSQL
jgi:cardiolipin synthase A/B